MTGKRRKGRDPKPVQAAATPAKAQATVVLVPQKSRREHRAERRRQARRRLGVLGISGVVVVALVVAAVVTFGVRHVTQNDSGSATGPTTLLFSLAAPDRTAAETALFAHDETAKQGVELLLPSRLLTEVCGFGDQQLGQILALPDGQRLSRGAVSDLLGGVTISGSWVLTTTQLAHLVDQVGGITADVDTDVVTKRSDGSRVLLVPAGANQRLTGAQAVAFATYVSGNEDASANLLRLQSVLDGLLAALPAGAAGIEHLVSTLGAGANSTLGSGRLAQLLADFKADVGSNKVLPTDLPVVKIDAGGQPLYRVDQGATTTFVQGNLASSLPASARVARQRVFVQNGVGTPGLVGTACEKLVAAGFLFAGSGNASSFGFVTSKVLIQNTSSASLQLGQRVATALKLPAADIAVTTEAQNVADVIVILGKDYKS
jgi:anionic cell wall polymer biosynthesis LytR-Cps2A-Psr (LCP) family protein